LKKNIKKQEKQEKTMMVLVCFWGFILFFIRPLADFVPLCASRLEEKHKKTGKTRKNNDGFIMFLGFYFVFYQAACGFCTILARRKNPRHPERLGSGDG